MFPVIHPSIRKVWAQLCPGHEDIRTCISLTRHGGGNNHERDAKRPDSTDNYHSLYKLLSTVLAFLQRFQMRRDQRFVIEELSPSNLGYSRIRRP
jgi:hypothetical protein